MSTSKIRDAQGALGSRWWTSTGASRFGMPVEIMANRNTAGQ